MTEFDAMGDLLESLGYPEWADKVRSLAWVAVEDRLPEELVEVLVTTYTDHRNGRLTCTTTATYANGWHDWRDRHGNVIRVSHWQPMPEPVLTAPPGSPASTPTPAP